MNEEEINKAMFWLEGLEYDKEHLVIEERQAISTIINLVKKQQKEIEKYRKLRADIIKVNKKIYDVDIIEDMCEQLANSISKDKIREKVEEMRKKHNNLIDSQTLLKELLGE